MTEQEVYNQARKHLLTQNKKSTLSADQKASILDALFTECAYRGVGNCKCVIGCFIPDKQYEIAMEGKSVGSLITRYKFIEDIFKGISESFLNDLQKIHDNFPEHLWESKLNDFAKKYDLKVQ